MSDRLRGLKAQFDPSAEPQPNLARCSKCGWEGGPVHDLESGYYEVHDCPKCGDGGCVDDYSMTAAQARKWDEWWKRTHPEEQTDE